MSFALDRTFEDVSTDPGRRLFPHAGLPRLPVPPTERNAFGQPMPLLHNAFRANPDILSYSVGGSSASTVVQGVTISASAVATVMDQFPSSSAGVVFGNCIFVPTAVNQFFTANLAVAGVEFGVTKTIDCTLGESSTGIPAVVSLGRDKTAVTATTVASPKVIHREVEKLFENMNSARSAARLDPDAVTVADDALRDAKVLVARELPAGDPLVMFASDGILTLQWQKGSYGAALLFAGDGEVSIAIKKPEQLYAQNGIDIKITESLPPIFRDILARIV